MNCIDFSAQELGRDAKIPVVKLGDAVICTNAVAAARPF